jgi:hypothetical protein
MSHLAKSIEHAEHLIIPNIGFKKFPQNMVFYNAKTLTIHKWHPQHLTANFNTHHFPSLKRINYLSGQNLPVRDIFEFTHNNHNFKWRMPQHKLLPYNFHYLPSYNIEYISVYDWFALTKKTTSQDNIERWTEYLNFKRKEFYG